MLINAFKICIKDHPNEMIINAIPTVKSHSFRNYHGSPVRIFSQIVCISSRKIAIQEDFDKDKLKLDQFPRDIFIAISKNLSATDIVNLSKVNRTIRSKISSIPKRMMFSFCLYDFTGYKPILNLCSHLSKFHQNIKVCHLSINDLKMINSLPKNINRLSLTNSGLTLNLNILESMDPEHFSVLREFGFETELKEIPLNNFIKFPNLIGFGTFDAPITLSKEDFVLLPKLVGHRLRSLNIGYIKNTKDEIIDTLNNLPLLKRLYFSIGEERKDLIEQEIIKLKILPQLESLKLQGRASIFIDNPQNFMIFMKKFPNLKIFWLAPVIRLIKGIDLRFWSRLEKLGLELRDDHEFWEEVLPRMHQLKVLSINPPNNKESYVHLSNLPNLEKLHFRQTFSKKNLDDLANSILKITEFSIIDESFFDEETETLNRDFLNIILQFPNLKILYIGINSCYFPEIRKIISLASRGRIQLVKDRPDFFEDELEY